jgi:hypothetical protein
VAEVSALGYNTASKQRFYFDLSAQNILCCKSCVTRILEDADENEDDAATDSSQTLSPPECRADSLVVVQFEI